jgi:hypothetical protein
MSVTQIHLTTELFWVPKVQIEPATIVTVLTSQKENMSNFYNLRGSGSWPHWLTLVSDGTLGSDVRTFLHRSILSSWQDEWEMLRETNCLW